MLALPPAVLRVVLPLPPLRRIRAGNGVGVANRCIRQFKARATRCRTAKSIRGRFAMAKGQVRKSKEARKPKKAKTKTIAANPQRSPLEHLKNN